MPKRLSIGKALLGLLVVASVGLFAVIWWILAPKSLEDPQSEAQRIMDPLAEPWPIRFDHVKAIKDSRLSGNRHVYFEVRFVGMEQRRVAAFLQDRLRQLYGEPDQTGVASSSSVRWINRGNSVLTEPSYAPSWWPGRKEVKGKVVSFTFGNTTLYILSDGRVFGYDYLPE